MALGLAPMRRSLTGWASAHGEDTWNFHKENIKQNFKIQWYLFAIAEPVCNKLT